MLTIADLVTHYLDEFPDEKTRLRQLLSLLTNTGDEADLRSRRNFVGHITASGFVVNRKTRRVLRLYHKKHRLHLQPGGHFEDNEICPLDVAKREVIEEIGLTDILHLPYHFNSDIPIDIDSHPIAKDPVTGEPRHFHHDFRYVFLTNSEEDAVSEMLGAPPAYQWDEVSELRRLVTFERIAEKLEQLLSRELRQRQFYDTITRRLQPIQHAHALIVTHILPDVLEYLSALANIADVRAIIPKPKSVVPSILQKVGSKFPVTSVTRDQLRDVDAIMSLLEDAPAVVLFDIGGWFAPIVNDLAARFSDRLLGVIEDTENGHQKYEALTKLAVPVVSVARSPLKDNEDFLVGQSVLFSADAILRDCGRLIQYLKCSILGFGKVGRSIAEHLLLRGVKPNVFDINPVRRVAAYNHLCNVPSREEIFVNSDVIFCATGNTAADIINFRSLKNGCFVFSVTSSDDEFNLAHLEAEYTRQQVAEFVDRYSSAGNYFYLVNNGNAVNFIHKAVLGDFINLVRAEMLVAYKLLVERQFQIGIQTVNDSCIRFLDS
jgi:adenosylhomocysteinase